MKKFALRRSEGGWGSHSTRSSAEGENFAQSANVATRPYRKYPSRSVSANSPCTACIHEAYSSSGTANPATAAPTRSHPTRFAIRNTTAGTNRNSPTDRVSPAQARTTPAPAVATAPGRAFHASRSTAPTTSASNNASDMNRDSRSIW